MRKGWSSSFKSVKRCTGRLGNFTLFQLQKPFTVKCPRVPQSPALPPLSATATSPFPSLPLPKILPRSTRRDTMDWHPPGVSVSCKRPAAGLHESTNVYHDRKLSISKRDVSNPSRSLRTSSSQNWKRRLYDLQFAVLQRLSLQ